MRAFETLRFVSLALALFACGEEESSPGDGGGGSGGAGGGGTGGAGASGLRPVDLFPLKNGNSWTYQVTDTSGGFCTSGTRQVSASGPTTYEGRQAFSIGDLCGGAELHYFAAAGDEVEEWFVSAWVTALPAPVQEGYTWITDGVGDYRWTRLGSVTVAAGTFSECWERTASDPGTADTSYCKGVGLVRSTLPLRTVELTTYAVQ